MTRAPDLPPGLDPQDRLDLLAVAAGWKPVAVFGHAGPWLKGLPDALAPLGLVGRIGAPWRVVPSGGTLPAWYAEAVAEALGALRLLYVHRPGTACPPPGQSLTEAEEAALLAYPACCAAAHHKRQGALHALCADQIARRTADSDQRRRLAGALLPPLAEDAHARAALAGLLEVAFAPHTPVALCEACASGTDTPAGRLSRRYATLTTEVLT